MKTTLIYIRTTAIALATSAVSITLFSQCCTSCLKKEFKPDSALEEAFEQALEDRIRTLGLNTKIDLTPRDGPENEPLIDVEWNE